MKRLFDIAVASALLIVLSPIIVVTGIMVLVALGRPVLFSQQRPGWHEVPFWLFKFRTMRDELSPSGLPLPDEQRMTRLGRFLRSSSLDELPTLINIIRGDMSLVGPRPLLTEYLPLYSDTQKRRHEVRPGLTGWAQVNGRNLLPWPERFELDVWYVDHRSFWLDAKILGLTFVKVLRHEGISQESHVTMEPFKGNPS